ncbi:MAG TPA: DUF459 domain-containing protein [Stellaceae bacterium]|nr:DUF459 domain-containing protein [Stellaceae bacterium]
MRKNGRFGAALRLAARLAVPVVILGFLVSEAYADEPAPQTTIVVFGDSQAAGLARGLQRVLVEDPHYRVLNRTHAGAALVHDEDEWLGPVERFASRDKADIAIVMFGANDRLDMRDEHHAYHFRTDEWRAAYAARADKIFTILANAKLKTIWCGNPIARSATYSDDMSYINGIYAEEAAKFGVQFVSLWTAIADDQGRYIAYGKDRDGVTERLRGDDGIHFTAAGYELIAEKIVGLLSAAAANTPQRSAARETR